MPPDSPPAQAPKPDSGTPIVGDAGRIDRHTVGINHRPPPETAYALHERERSFTAVYQQHVERIYRYHLARTGSVDDAQDLTAETFHAALESFAAFDPALGSAAAWLTGIAQHKLMDHFRRSRRFDSNAMIEDQPDRAASTEETGAKHMQMAQVSAALLRLPSARAEALSLHFFAGLSVSETAQVMRRSDEAVKKLIHRGLADLRRVLDLPPAAMTSMEVTE